MNLLFVHDHKFFKYQNKYYSTGGLSGEVLQRYVDIFKTVTIVGRCIEIDKFNQDLSLSSIDGTHFVTVPNYKSIKTFYNICKVQRILENEIINSNYIIIRTSSLGNLAAKYAKKYNKPYLIEVVGCSWDSLRNYNLLGKLLAPYEYMMQKKAVKNASYALYVTTDFLQRRYPSKGKTISCSDVSLPPLNEKTLEFRLNKINQITSEKTIVIGTIGAVNVRYKGQEYVIKAISRLNKKGYNFEYHLAGGGNDNYLKSIAEEYGVADKIKFLGSIPHEKIFEYLDALDIYIQPSKTEGLPRALIEAMSRGCPAMGSNVGGIPEVLNPELVFSKNSVNEICELLKNIDKDILISEAKRSFEKARKFDQNSLKELRTTFYSKLLNRDSGI